MISVEENSRGFFVEREALTIDTARFVPLFIDAADFARRLARRPGLHWNRYFEVWGGRRNKKGFGGFATAAGCACVLS
jgi:hypothetical protein